MPTGYTAAVADGTITKLADFVRLYAHSRFRDLEIREPLPAVWTSDSIVYHDEELADARARLDRLTGLDAEGRKAARDAEAAENRRRNAEMRAEQAATAQRYATMIEKLRSVSDKLFPKRFKDEMVQHLVESQQHDSLSVGYLTEPEQQDIDDWYREAIAEAVSDIAYYEKARAEAIARDAETNAWLAHLHTGLAQIETMERPDDAA